MIEDKFGDKLRPDDPRRCQSGGRTGQCPYARVENSEYCPRHGGPHLKRINEEKKIRAYNLSRWQGRVNEFADHEQVKSLREEVGITRMLLETLVTQCKDETELLMYAGKISDIVIKIEKLVSSCHRLEASTGMLLDKSAVIQLAAVIVEIISRHVDDADAIDSIANEIILGIMSMKPELKK